MHRVTQLIVIGRFEKKANFHVAFVNSLYIIHLCIDYDLIDEQEMRHK